MKCRSERLPIGATTSLCGAVLSRPCRAVRRILSSPAPGVGREYPRVANDIKSAVEDSVAGRHLAIVGWRLAGALVPGV
jgi:hypothetical protein